MAIGIGGAGSKIAAKLSPTSTAVNVSQTELSKVDAANKILAHTSTAKGQLQGSKKDPNIGRASFASIRQQILDIVEGETVITSSGGGSGNGITSEVLDLLAKYDEIDQIRKTRFMVLLPYVHREPQEYIENTLSFLKGPLSRAVDSTNTGNIYLFSNKAKFEGRISEDNYNQLMINSIKEFSSIPRKGKNLELLEGHIDEEDFEMYQAKSYFNYFTAFDYDPERYFGDQLNENQNPFLLQPKTAVEALFLLEVPENFDSTIFYNILDHFDAIQVKPVYSVVRNPALERPKVTVSLLYPSKPDELVEEFQRVSEETTNIRIQRSLEQKVQFEEVAVNMSNKAEQISYEKGQPKDEVLTILKRLGKIK